MTTNPDKPDRDADLDESIGAIAPAPDDEEGKAIDLPLEPGDANSQPGA